MLKIWFSLILIIHGLIHLIGFVKAYNYAEIKELKLPISKPLGIIWFSTCMLFIAAVIQLIFNIEYWWLTTVLATIFSQLLIILSWQDAKFGTLLNIVIILLVALS